MRVNMIVGPSRTRIPALPDTQPMAKQRTPHAIEIGRRIATLRKQAGFKQAQLAERIGIERGTLAGIEVGLASPGRSTLAALATLLGVTMDHIETGAPLPSHDSTGDSVKAHQDARLLFIWGKMLPGQRDALLDYLDRMFGVSVDAGHSEPPSVNAA